VSRPVAAGDRRGVRRSSNGTEAGEGAGGEP